MTQIRLNAAPARHLLPQRSRFCRVDSAVDTSPIRSCLRTQVDVSHVRALTAEAGAAVAPSSATSTGEPMSMRTGCIGRAVRRCSWIEAPADELGGTPRALRLYQIALKPILLA